MNNLFCESRNSTYIIAEIGGNHNGDFQLAKQLIYEAANSGVNAVKFQTYKTEKLICKKIPVFPRAKVLGHKTQFDRFKSLELNDGQLQDLCFHAKKHNVDFLSTPFDKESVDTLNSMVSAFKVASSDIINFQLLRDISSKGKPVFLSTGQADLNEIDAAISILSNNPLSLLHCVSSYPTPDEEVNLYSIPFLIDKYKVPVGYSDHTIGFLACIGAVVAGAVVIEKHFTLDNSQNFGDHILSATPKDMKLMVSEIRRIEKMVGTKNKKCQQSELISKTQLRRSLHINTDIKEDTILKSNMITPLISNDGIPANKIDEILGKKIIKKMKKFDAIKENFLIDCKKNR